jgi:hypothetical protein
MWRDPCGHLSCEAEVTRKFESGMTYCREHALMVLENRRWLRDWA